MVQLFLGCPDLATLWLWLGYAVFFGKAETKTGSRAQDNTNTNDEESVVKVESRDDARSSPTEGDAFSNERTQSSATGDDHKDSSRTPTRGDNYPFPPFSQLPSGESTCLSACVNACLRVCLSACPSVCLSAFLYFCYLSVSVYLLLCLLACVLDCSVLSLSLSLSCLLMLLVWAFRAPNAGWQRMSSMCYHFPHLHCINIYDTSMGKW